MVRKCAQRERMHGTEGGRGTTATLSHMSPFSDICFDHHGHMGVVSAVVISWTPLLHRIISHNLKSDRLPSSNPIHRKNTTNREHIPIQKATNNIQRTRCATEHLLESLKAAQ